MQKLYLNGFNSKNSIKVKSFYNNQRMFDSIKILCTSSFAALCYSVNEIILKHSVNVVSIPF